MSTIVIDFSKIDLHEQPVLILKNTSGKPIGTLGYASDISLDIKYNETSVLEFKIPEQVDGVKTPYYDSVVGMRVVDVADIGQFILINPSEASDGVKKIKSCKGYSLEYEFTFKKITLENATYNFWNPVAASGTLLEAVLELMPSWSVGTVDSTLVGKYRTFEVADTNLYSFIKSTVQQAYNCVFDFDTINRKINVKDVMSDVNTNPIYISTENLAKEITVTENTENIITRLDVNGAEGVTIREVNPTGTNTLINLDYFMTPDNFDQGLIKKYYDWKDAVSANKTAYYNLSIEYTLRIMARTAETAALTELKAELASLEDKKAVTMQNIMAGNDSLDIENENTAINNKNQEISDKQRRIDNIQSQIDAIYTELKNINSVTKFEKYFTDEEVLILDRYIKDDSVSESSFVTKAAGSYSDDDVGTSFESLIFNFSDAEVAAIYNESGKTIYDIRGGKITLDDISSDVISAAFETFEDGSAVMSGYLGAGKIGEREFTGACLSVTGSINFRSVAHDLKPQQNSIDLIRGTRLSAEFNDGYRYFTFDTSEYERRSVAWDLYEYGENILNKMSQPSFQFSVSSANFLSLDDFAVFKNNLRHGEKIYVGISEDKTLSPICIGMQINYGKINDLTLEFGDTYTSSDSSFLLADLLEQSVSMGKNVDLSKFTYSAFIDSGASTRVKEFMTSALDVSKNAIMSSKNQAITWDESGIRLRKWMDESHAEYEKEQVWLNNNSIMMTDSNWDTAKVAIGKFEDTNFGKCYGIVAPSIVGTLLAGENLVIESTKKDGDNSVFKVDADGCILYNSQFDIVSANKKAHISLDPQLGIVVGKHPVYNKNDSGTRTVDENNAQFWVDTNGNLNFKGTLRAATGEFTGKVTATSGNIGTGDSTWTIGSTGSGDSARAYIYSKKSALSSSAEGVYIGTDGISIGGSSKSFKVTNDGTLTANSVAVTGGKIGGFTINADSISYNGLTWGGTGIRGVYIGNSGIQLGDGFSVDLGGYLTANSGKFRGTIYAGNIVEGGTKSTMSGSLITQGTISGGEKGKIRSGAITTYNTASGINTSLGHGESAYSACFGGSTMEAIACRGISSSGLATLSGGLTLLVNGTLYPIKGDYVTLATPDGGSETIYYLAYN